jgi:hypothetical protein
VGPNQPSTVGPNQLVILTRAGDPDLHTHVAVANKVQTFGGRWLSIDGRVLFKATVPASET